MNNLIYKYILDYYFETHYHGNGYDIYQNIIDNLGKDNQPQMNRNNR